MSGAIQAICGRLYFALPKGKKARTVGMPSSVADELKRHVEAFPPGGVELPWGVAVNTWNTYTWKLALVEAGIVPPRAEGANPWQWAAGTKDGFHVLRHTYASMPRSCRRPESRS
ncbi:hypothetical protein ABZ078_31225 [Streptomyces sp. NPDC006385]|uniref:hypothetical protein n=1 Tax=Streptomyces sp. NPDC006385 TaxID=3156761 RepID=UPI0033A0151C